MATKNYLALEQEKIHRPSEVDVPWKFLIYAKNKIGKTHFCKSAEDVLIMDPRNGADRLKRSDPRIWPIRNWQDVQDQYEWAKRYANERGYKTFAYDDFPLIYKSVLYGVAGITPKDSLTTAQKIIKIQHYGTANDIVSEWLQGLEAIGINVIITAQEKGVDNVSAEEDDEADIRDTKYVIALSDGVRITLKSWADVIGRLYVVRTNVKYKVKDEDEEKGYRIEEKLGLQRRLWMSPHESYDTGFRSEYSLPDYLINPTVPRLIRLLETGSANAAKAG